LLKTACCVFSAALITACGRTVASQDPIFFDPCLPLRVAAPGDCSSSQRDSVSSGLDMWNRVAHTDLELDEEPGVPTIPVQFQHAAKAFFGLYEAGVIYVNSGIADDHARAVTVAHELGHAFGLVHVNKSVRLSVMNVNNYTIEPNEGDVEALTHIWGVCAAPQTGVPP
jgi:hypothetical protein